MINKFETLLAGIVLFASQSSEEEDFFIPRSAWEKIADSLKIPVKTKAMSAMDSTTGGALVPPAEFTLKPKKKTPIR